MQLSQRITQLTNGGSDGWDVFYRARQMIADGIAVTELTVGEHDIGTAPEILQAMHRSAMGGHTGYAMVPGVGSLRDVVAQRVTQRTGIPTRRDNVLITPGGQAALFAAHAATCDAGDKALYLDPYYATYPGTIRATGAVAHAVETRAEDGFHPRAADIDAVAHDARSLLINSPNNPTGAVYSRNTLESIAQVCSNRDLWLISDEVYDTQVWRGSHLSPRALPGMVERTLVVGSMSKSHAMTGSRCGWIIGPEPAIARLIDLATNTTYGVPGFVQDAAEFALKQGAPLEQSIAAPFRRRLDLANAIFAEQAHLRAVPTQGAMYIMLDIRATGMSGEQFANGLLDAHRIAVMPGESFGRAARGHVRIAMTVDDERFEAALRTLCDYARSV